jgi:methanethiol S-methyltransferase
MIAWINFVVLLVATLLVLYLELKSAKPAALEEKIGAVAYDRCTRYRMLASLLMGLAGVNYIIYFLYPLPMPLPRTFPWSWWVSVGIAVIFTIPAAYLWWREMNAAADESNWISSQPYGDVYERNQHPHLASELPFWWSISFLLHSPFLVLFSLVWAIGLEIASSVEDRDLLLRYRQRPTNRNNVLMPNSTV